jgi:hypothetical protein
MSSTKLSVLIADEHRTHLRDVLHRLREAGFEVDQVMDTIGTVTGSIDASKVSALSGIDGVAAVERSYDYQLPPPDADIQ